MTDEAKPELGSLEVQEGKTDGASEEAGSLTDKARAEKAERMHSELEAKFGSQGSELGAARAKIAELEKKLKQLVNEEDAASQGHGASLPSSQPKYSNLGKPSPFTFPPASPLR